MPTTISNLKLGGRFEKNIAFCLLQVTSKCKLYFAYQIKTIQLEINQIHIQANAQIFTRNPHSSGTQWNLQVCIRCLSNN